MDPSSRPVDVVVVDPPAAGAPLIITGAGCVTGAGCCRTTGGFCAGRCTIVVFGGGCATFGFSLVCCFFLSKKIMIGAWAIYPTNKGAHPAANNPPSFRITTA